MFTEAAREGDLSIYNGVITIEDTTIENPFRIFDKSSTISPSI